MQVGVVKNYAPSSDEDGLKAGTPQLVNRKRVCCDK
jgi:hypothetical protein